MECSCDVYGENHLLITLCCVIILIFIKGREKNEEKPIRLYCNSINHAVQSGLKFTVINAKN